MALDCSLTIQSRSYLSIVHIQAAATCAKLAIQFETEYPQDKRIELHGIYAGYVVGSVILSAAFLEATINELFCDAADSNLTRLNQVDKAAVNMMSKMWFRQIPRTAHYKIAEKYQIALDLTGKEAFDEGRCPFQDVKCLVDLRNALIHYESECSERGSNGCKPGKLERKFEGCLQGKFDLNPLMGPGNAFYPDKCLSSGCASWAVLCSVQFTDDFFKKMGMKPPYDHVRLCLDECNSKANKK